MDKKVFSERIKMLEDHCQKRLKSPDLYWEELQNIPDEPWIDIVRGWVKSHPPSPGSFPTIEALNNAWQGPGGWLDRHPERKAKPIREWCPYCESDAPGVIEVMIPVDKPKYRTGPAFRDTLVRCGHCRNSEDRNPTWPRLKREEIEARGWEIISPMRPDSDKGDMGVKPPSDQRSPGFKHLEASLPVGDREEQEPPF